MREYDFLFEYNGIEKKCMIRVDNKLHSVPNSINILEKDNNYIVYETNERGYPVSELTLSNIDDAINTAEKWKKLSIILHETPRVTLKRKRKAL